MKRTKPPKAVSAFMAESGRHGGQARARVLSRTRRREIARNAAAVRWARERARKARQAGRL